MESQSSRERNDREDLPWGCREIRYVGYELRVGPVPSTCPSVDGAWAC